MEIGINFTGAMLDSLIGMVERGPLEDGDVPSKAGRDELIRLGLAVRVVVKGEDGYTGATYAGRDAYTRLHGADTVREAMDARKRAREEARAKEAFPVLGAHKYAGCPAQVRKSELNEDWAQKIHGQTLGQLARRGGLSPAEILVNIERRPYSAFGQITAQAALEAVFRIALA